MKGPRPRTDPAADRKAPARPARQARTTKPAHDGPPRYAGSDGVRLQKVLSEAGIASRRSAEELIRQGRVLVNDRPARLGMRIDREADRVSVDGERVVFDTGKLYLMLNKPEGVVTTSRDPEGRPTVLDLIGAHGRVFPVGRLDIATEGLLLLTNDGELTHRLTHPSFEVAKIYVAEVAGVLGRAALRRLTETGVDLGEAELFRADSARVVGLRRGRDPRTVVELVVHEGPKHVVRRLLEAVGNPVVRLVRTGLGPLRLNRLGSGTYRNLSRDEVASLYREVGL